MDIVSSKKVIRQFSNGVSIHDLVANQGIELKSEDINQLLKLQIANKQIFESLTYEEIDEIEKQFFKARLDIIEKWAIWAAQRVYNGPSNEKCKQELIGYVKEYRNYIGSGLYKIDIGSGRIISVSKDYEVKIGE